MSMLREILPNEVIVVEQLGSPVGTLLDEEAAALGQAVLSRRVEFAAGRTCARNALSVLGVPAQPILRGLYREPIWPTGTVGSITHCNGYFAAAVARNQRIESIGIDAEPNEPLPEGVLREIALVDEIRALEYLPPEHISWDRLLFCAKESVFKAWYPIMKCWLGFEEACVVIDPIAMTFQAQIRPKHPRAQKMSSLLWHGRFAQNVNHIFTAIVVYR